MLSLSTIGSFISLLNEFNLLNKWYVVLLFGILAGPILSHLEIDYKIHKFLFDKFGFGKKIIEKNILFKLIDSIFVGTTWWLSIQQLFLKPLFNLSIQNYNWIYLSIFILGFLLKFAFGRSYIYENDFLSSSKSWRYTNFLGNGSFLTQLINVWKTYSYPSMHTIILFSGLFLGIFTIELYVLAILTILWLLFVNHHWFSDIVSGLLISYSGLLFIQQVL